MNRDDVLQLLTHMEWADSRIWNAVIAIDAALRDRTLMERLHHVHVVQRIYLQMWLGNSDPGRELSTFADLAEVHGWARAYYRDLRSFVDGLDAATLTGHVEFPWADQLAKWFGEARSATLKETVIQVAMHSSHHRGQLATMIRQLGAEPPLVDFIGWVWMGKPEPAWEALRSS